MKFIGSTYAETTMHTMRHGTCTHTSMHTIVHTLNPQILVRVSLYMYMLTYMYYRWIVVVYGRGIRIFTFTTSDSKTQ